MLRGGEVVLAAVSGGADSVALLDLLAELREPLRLALHALHVHHGLRAEADQDAAAVEALSARLAVPFHLVRVAVRQAPPWEGLEAEARRARHRALRAGAAAVGAAVIATGHTADDQAETVLMRLLQGAGPRGLGGIAPVRRPYIRPLIETHRSEIEAHCRARGLAWVEDPSNRDLRFLRNRIRHQLLPLLGEVCAPNPVESLCRSAALARRLVADLEQRAADLLDRLGRRGPCGVVLPAAEVARVPEEVGVQLVLAAAAALGHRRPLRGAAHRALRRVLGAAPPRRPVRLERLAVERSGRWLRVGPAALAPVAARSLTVPGALDLPEVGLRLEAHVLERGLDYAPPRERHCVAFDADCVPPALLVRARRTGDRFAPWGAPGERRLKSFLIDAGVPRWERPRLPLLEADGEILWLAGVRRGRGAPIAAETRRILEVTVRPL
jgi:tRNA(Ile)-lysidine synthase